MGRGGLWMGYFICVLLRFHFVYNGGGPASIAYVPRIATRHSNWPNHPHVCRNIRTFYAFTTRRITDSASSTCAAATSRCRQARARYVSDVDTSTPR